ncbi:hypothetical protein [Geodermatophilus chilensis]|uniref:hypothetical protein n=1 Tax=Geodermatophilus chilensis TaxID=2035835 RepID=UPI000C25C119|nr:hypothetical protein [Geodermatophilus chilensis]
MPEVFRRLDPPRSVLVRHDDGRWYTGSCSGWTRQPEGGWRAIVEYTAAVGSKYVRAVDPEHVELVGE